MTKKILPSFALLSLFLLGACSTNKVALQDQNDDVYYSVAQAREAAEPTVRETRTSDVVTDKDIYSDEHSATDEYSDYDYATRINRFHRYSPWRGYYDYYDPFDPYYNRYSYYSPYSYYPYNRGLHISLYFGRPLWYDPFFYGYNYRYDYYGFGYPYNSWYGYNRWGMYSYYNSYPGYYGGVGRATYASPNYRPRPSRDFDNMRPGVGGNGGRGSVRTDADGRVVDTRTRAERYGDGRSSGTTTGDVRATRPQATSGSRPTRTDVSRPSRNGGSYERERERTSSTPARSERYTPPPSPPASSGSSNPSSGRSSSGSSSSSRPSRGN